MRPSCAADLPAAMGEAPAVAGVGLDRPLDRVSLPILAKVCAAAAAISLPVLIAGFAARDRLVHGLSLGAVT